MATKHFVAAKPYINEVESLLRRIRQIQADCKHDYRNTEGVMLEESKVKDVYKVGSSGVGIYFTLTCVNCSHEKFVLATQVCPNCTESLHKQPSQWVRSYDGRWGRDLTWYAQEMSCPKCGLRVVFEYCDPFKPHRPIQPYLRG